MFKKSQRNHSINEVLNELKFKNVVIIQGLRRIGKSAVMYTVSQDQMFDSYIQKDFMVGFFGQNDSKVALDLLNEVQGNQDKKYLILVDEFQDLKDWDKFFMTLHRFNNVKIIATGSVSANQDLVNNTEGGRFGYIQMQPLSFNEYKVIDSSVGLSDEESFDKFATFGSYPEQEFTTDIITYKKQVSENILEKIKNITLLKNASLDNPQYVNNVLMFIIENVGSTMSDNSIATKLGIDIRTIGKILSFLKQTFIIYEVSNSYQSKGKAAQSNKKYYLTDHTFFLFVKQNEYKNLVSPYKDFVFENIILNEVRKAANRYEIEIRFEIDKENKIDFDLVTVKNDVKKYFEIKNTTETNSLSKNQKQNGKGNNVIYLGETKMVNEIQYINYIDFIKGVKQWL